MRRRRLLLFLAGVLRGSRHWDRRSDAETGLAEHPSGAWN